LTTSRIYRSRWLVGAFILTLPFWFIPALIWIGWREAGRDLFRELPAAIRWTIRGK